MTIYNKFLKYFGILLAMYFKKEVIYKTLVSASRLVTFLQIVPKNIGIFSKPVNCPVLDVPDTLT